MHTTRQLATLVLILAAAVPAVAFERVEIRNKDLVLGAITELEPTHEYLIDVPRNAIVSLSLPKQKDSRLQGSMGLFSFQYRAERLLQIGKRKIQKETPPGASATYRAIVQGVNGSTGLYALKPKVKVQKRYVIRGKRSDLSPPGQIVFGALPGYDVDVKIAWKGPDAVTIGSFTAPDGSDMTTTEAGKQKGSTFRQKGYRTAQFGDHRLVLDIPPSANQWTLQIVQKAKSESRTLNLRVAQGKPPELDLQVAGGPLPVILVKGEQGAGNEILLAGNNTSPRVIGVLGGSPQSCALTQLQPGNTPTEYAFVCDDTHSALLTVGQRDANRRILDYVADPVVAPGGSGRTAFSDFVYDAGNRLVGWTEKRTFDASGNVHELVVTDVLSVNGAYIYSVLHTRPDGTTRRYDRLPF